MTCTYCTTELPAGAMFCGECGRAVVAESAEKPARTSSARPRRRVSAPGGSPSPVREAVVVEVAAKAMPPSKFAVSSQTAAAKPAVSLNPSAADVDATRAEPGAAVTSAAGPHSHTSESAVVDLVTRCKQCNAELGSDDIFCGECGYVTRSASRNFSRPRDTAIIQAAQVERDAMTAAASLARSEEASAPEPEWGLGDSGDALEDVEATRIVAQRRTGARFVLQFSTGESFTVYGSGLVGRNPHPEPAEYFDHIVRVLDPSRSVSKTHLEFGQESGAFWIKDRFSGNGSIVREPEGDPVRCQPDRRYRVVRGTRVDIGEQFFVVS